MLEDVILYPYNLFIQISFMRLEYYHNTEKYIKIDKKDWKAISQNAVI